MSRYVDGFVFPVKKKKLNAYKKMAIIGYKAWMKFGALDYYECVSAKLDNGWGLGFSKLTKLKSDEVLIFAYIVYKSKSHREQVTKKVHKYFGEIYKDHKDFEMPYDMKKFSSGEFKTLIHSK